MATAKSRGEKQRDIMQVLTREHRVVAAILDDIEEACEGEEFDRIPDAFEILKSKVTVHAKGEESAVYPAFAELNDELKDLIGEANEEHSLVTDKLQELSTLDVRDETWKAKFTVLKELIEHHVEDEEGEVFPAADKAMSTDEASELADRYLATKRQIAGDEAEQLTEYDLETMSKEDLLEEARGLGLEGTSSMTKDELVEALSARA